MFTATEPVTAVRTFDVQGLPTGQGIYVTKSVCEHAFEGHPEWFGFTDLEKFLRAVLGSNVQTFYTLRPVRRKKTIKQAPHLVLKRALGRNWGHSGTLVVPCHMICDTVQGNYLQAKTFFLSGDADLPKPAADQSKHLPCVDWGKL